MTLILLKLGIILIPFYELLAKACPYGVVMPPDTRVAKTFIGLWLALVIGLSAIFSGEIKSCKNKWLLLFLAFIPLSIHLSPQYNIKVNGADATNYWVWKPFVTILCYFLMFMAIQSMQITRKSLSKIFTTIVWCGVVMAGYTILQDFGWDQFFDIRTGGFKNTFFFAVTKPGTVGSLGNSTIVSPYLAMIIPLALYLKRYISAIVLICATLLCQSEMATGAMIVSLILYSCLRWRIRAVFPILLAAILGISVLTGIKVTNPQKFDKISSNILQNNGRLNVWKQAIRVTKEEKFGAEEGSRYPFTGTGIGSYQILIRPLAGSSFAQAHNEYIEVLCTLGIVGLFLFGGSIWFMGKSVFYSYISGINQSELLALSSSFVCIALVAFGTFIWQLSPHNYYTVIVAGLLHNTKLLKGELE